MKRQNAYEIETGIEILVLGPIRGWKAEVYGRNKPRGSYEIPVKIRKVEGRQVPPATVTARRSTRRYVFTVTYGRGSMTVDVGPNRKIRVI